MKPEKKRVLTHKAKEKLRLQNKKPGSIKAENTKPEDWVCRKVIMAKFGFSLRCIQYYHNNGVLPYSILGKRTLYYMPGILRILEQGLIY